MAHRFHQPASGELLSGIYQLTEKIAQGGFASVWSASQITTGDTVAVKFMLPTRMNDTATVKRFRREAKLMLKLDHPNIVNVLDYGVTQPENHDTAGVPFLVMEFLRGQTLEQALEADNDPMAMERAIALVLPVLDALHEAHAHGIIHRDLKPDNIFIAEVNADDTQIKLLDFGICKPLESSTLLTVPDRLTKTDQVFGTPDYMAPEQISADPLSPATDIYSIGIMLYELLSGRRPFMAANAVKVMIKHLDDPMPDLPDPYRAHPINALIHHCTVKEPDNRLRSAAELAEALRGLPPMPEGAVEAITQENRRRAAEDARTTRPSRKRGRKNPENIGDLDTLDAESPTTTNRANAIPGAATQHTTRAPLIAAVIGTIIVCAVIAWIIFSA